MEVPSGGLIRPGGTEASGDTRKQGPAVKIPLSRPDIGGHERRAVLEVLGSPRLALGPRLEEFERRLAALHGRRFAVAVNSGTSALHLAMLALGVRPGDEVLTTPFSFIASTNCILYADGVPRFVDVDPGTWNLDPARLEAALTPRTVGVLPVHVFGVPCDMDAIGDVARRHGLWVVEDACEAIGARDGAGLVGRRAEISVLAFYPNKQITTGEGGALLTDDPRVDRLCRSLRNQGRDGRGSRHRHERLGYNYRLSDIAAALGLAQLERLDELLARRARVAALYAERLAGCRWLRWQVVPPGLRKSWFVQVVALGPEFDRRDRDRILGGLRARGIGCAGYFQPIHLQPFIQERLGCRRGDLPACEALSDRTVALPFHGNLGEAEVDLVCAALLEIGEAILAEKTASRRQARAG